MENKSTFGLSRPIAGLLAALPVIGLIFYLVEKEDKDIRMTGIQSTVIWVIWVLISVVLRILVKIPIIGAIIGAVTTIIVLAIGILTIFMAARAYQEDYFRIPIVADVIESMKLV